MLKKLFIAFVCTLGLLGLTSCEAREAGTLFLAYPTGFEPATFRVGV